MSLTQDEIMDIINPYLDELRACPVSAVNDYNVQYKQLRSRHSLRSQASIIHDLMRDYATILLRPLKDVYIYEDINGLFIVEFHGKVQVRFKKLNSNMKFSNIPTQQTLDFYEQLELPGIPAAARLVVGYILDETQTQLRKVAITCPKTCSNGQENEWHHELEEFSVVEIPESLIESGITLAAKRVRPKEIIKIKE